MASEVIESVNIIRHTVIASGVSAIQDFFQLARPTRRLKVEWLKAGNFVDRSTLTQQLSVAASQGKAVDLFISSTAEFRLDDRPFAPNQGETIGIVKIVSSRFD